MANESVRKVDASILLVDDDRGAKDRLELAFSSVPDLKDIQVLQAFDVASALDLLSHHNVHVVLLDKNLDESLTPENNGIEAIPEILRIQPHVQILMVTGSRNIGDVVRAMKLGAFGYLTKDSEDELLVSQIDRALHVAFLKIEKTRRDRSEGPTGQEMGGKSLAFQRVLGQAEVLSSSNRPILILGETGTGKTELAKWTHQQRMKALGQKDRPFFSINVAALSKDLIESELFGHEKGAFTDAVQSRQGLFELSNGGTLFLDEIGELPLDLQPKLLKVIEEGTFMRVGGTKQIHSAPKLVFATHRDLGRMVTSGTFREDLYMRISIFPIQMPSLSERKGDIPDIIRKLLPRSCKENRVTIEYEDLPADFVLELSSSPVSGNIRGIQHQLERLLMLSPRDKDGNPILSAWKRIPGLCGAKPTKKESSASLPYTEWIDRSWRLLGPGFPGWHAFLDEVKKRVVAEALEHYGTNRARAKALGIFESKASELVKRYSDNTSKRGTHER